MSSDSRLPAYVTTTGRTVPMPYNGSVARVSFGPLVAGRVRRWLADGRFDVVHIHEPATPSVSVLALWAARVPVVATFHTAQERSWALETTAATFLRAGLAKIDAHIAVSDEAHRTMARYVDAEPTLIPNGVHVARFAGAPRRARRRPAAGVRRAARRAAQGAAGAPARRCRTILRDRPTAELVVVGDGSARALTRGCRPASSTASTSPARSTTAPRRGCSRAADVLVAPNTHGESFGVVLLEAMAAGAAVAASDLPAFRSVLGDGRVRRALPGRRPRRPRRRSSTGCSTTTSGAAGWSTGPGPSPRGYDWGVAGPPGPRRLRRA